MSGKGIIIIAIVLCLAWIIFGEKIHRLMAEIFTSKAKKEECIRQLMDGVSGSDEFKTCKKLCTPLTAKDLAGRKLNNQIIYYLNTHRGLDFAAEAVKQASNSESLINSIREDYIRRLINGESNFNVREISEKVCAPLTVEDFTGRTLSKENVYSLDKTLSAKFVADVVKQAPNSEALMKSVLDDLTSEVYEKKRSDCRHAESILKAAYQKGIYTEEIQAKDGTALQPHMDIDSCLHDDRPGIYFRL